MMTTAVNERNNKQPIRPQNARQPELLTTRARKAKTARCIWSCGRETPNRSRICDFCWTCRGTICIDRVQKARQELSPGKQNALIKAREARAAKFADQLPPTSFSDGVL
jgi:hypothetical protein